MEFGSSFRASARANGPTLRSEEHKALMDERDLVVTADRNNWKYVWVTEHHALTEYSHISASDVYMGYLANATKRIHLGSGIFNLSPRVNSSGPERRAGGDARPL